MYDYTCLALFNKQRNSFTDCNQLFAFFTVHPIIIVKLDLFFATSNSKEIRRNHTAKKPSQKISIYVRYCDDIWTMKIFERFYRLHWFYLELCLYISFVDVYHTVVFGLTMHHFFFVHHSTTLRWNGTIVDISIYKSTIWYNQNFLPV